MNFRSKIREPLRVDVTPLIDIVFQLVIFFMVSTTFDDSPSIDINLPESSSKTLIRESQDIEIWISKEGGFFIERQEQSLEQVKSRLQQGLQRNKGVVVIVKADTEVEHGDVVLLLNLAQEVGVKKLSIGARQNSEQ